MIIINFNTPPYVYDPIDTCLCESCKGLREVGHHLGKNISFNC